LVEEVKYICTERTEEVSTGRILFLISVTWYGNQLSCGNTNEKRHVFCHLAFNIDVFRKAYADQLFMRLMEEAYRHVTENSACQFNEADIECRLSRARICKPFK
jgi:hypothetical protein